MTTDEPVKRTSLRRWEPIAAPIPLTVLPERTWTEEEWQRIRLGHRSHGMDDKWNVFVEDHRLYAQRSRTGRGIYEVEFGPASEGGWRITEALVESDSEFHPHASDERDSTMLQIIVSGIVLGIRDPGLWARWREAGGVPRLA